MTQVDEFNALCARLADGQITEPEFCTIAKERLGYTEDELRVVVRKLRLAHSLDRRA